MDHTTPPAERLHAAAQRLREAANAATPSADPYPGGWAGFGHDADPCGRSMLFGGPGVDGYRTATIASVGGEDCEAGCIPMCDADAQYVALMHPAVGLAVADWLDAALRASDSAQAPNGSFLPARALAVADQILGIPASRALAETAAAS